MVILIMRLDIKKREEIIIFQIFFQWEIELIKNSLIAHVSFLWIMPFFCSNIFNNQKRYAENIAKNTHGKTYRAPEFYSIVLQNHNKKQNVRYTSSKR